MRAKFSIELLDFGVFRLEAGCVSDIAGSDVGFVFIQVKDCQGKKDDPVIRMNRGCAEVEKDRFVEAVQFRQDTTVARIKFGAFWELIQKIVNMVTRRREIRVGDELVDEADVFRKRFLFHETSDWLLL